MHLIASPLVGSTDPVILSDAATQRAVGRIESTKTLWGELSTDNEEMPEELRDKFIIVFGPGLSDEQSVVDPNTGKPKLFAKRRDAIAEADFIVEKQGGVFLSQLDDRQSYGIYTVAKCEKVGDVSSIESMRLPELCPSRNWPADKFLIHKKTFLRDESLRSRGSRAFYRPLTDGPINDYEPYVNARVFDTLGQALAAFAQSYAIEQATWELVAGGDNDCTERPRVEGGWLYRTRLQTEHGASVGLTMVKD